MTKKISVILFLITILLISCTTTDTAVIPTQADLPTGVPTDAPTQTAEPTDVLPPTPTELVIPRSDAQNPNEQAFLRVINTSPDLGVMDVYIESLAVAINLEFGRFTERQGIVAGRYKLRVLPTGSFVTDPSLYEEELTIFGGQSLIFLLTGTDENLSVTTLIETNEPLPNDTSRLLLVNALAGADDMVMLVNGLPQTAVTPYLQSSEAFEYPAGSTDLIFQNFGDIILEIGHQIRERQNYTFVILGSLDRPDTIKFLILDSVAPGLTTISFVNASPSLGLIDIYFGDELLESGADYSEISVPQPILSGTYDISIYPELANPDEIDPITGTQFIANPDEDVVLVLVGEPSSLRFVIYRNNPQPTYDNLARITFINALESVPNVILSATDEDLNMRLSYGRLSDTFDIFSEQTLSLTWIQQLDNVQDIALESVDNFDPEPGKNYLYVFSGSGFDDPILLSLDVGTLGFEFEEAVPITQVPTSRPTVIRLVNMWQGQTFIARLDGTVIAEGLDYTQASNPLIITSGEHTILFSDAETDTEVIEITAMFDVASQYSIVPYDLSDGEGDILLIDDSDTTITSATGGLRLIVLEADPESLFGIGYSAPTANISQPDSTENYRRSLSVGITQLAREIPSSQTSETHRIPIGTYNIRIIDNEAVAVTFTHTEYTVEAQTLYNVFLREDLRTRQTNTIIVPYTTFSG